MSDNEEDTPKVVVRRRRRIVRHVREKTPEPSSKPGYKEKFSDDESPTNVSNNNIGEKSTENGHAVRVVDTTENVPTATSKTSTARKSPIMSAHRSKILSRRDKAVGTSAVRSQSTPRAETNNEDKEPVEKVSIFRQVKRSLSSPR